MRKMLLLTLMVRMPHSCIESSHQTQNKTQNAPGRLGSPTWSVPPCLQPNDGPPLHSSSHSPTPHTIPTLSVVLAAFFQPEPLFPQAWLMAFHLRSLLKCPLSRNDFPKSIYTRPWHCCAWLRHTFSSFPGSSLVVSGITHNQHFLWSSKLTPRQLHQGNNLERSLWIFFSSKSDLW